MAYVVAYHTTFIAALVSWHYQTHGGTTTSRWPPSSSSTSGSACRVALLCYPATIQRGVRPSWRSMGSVSPVFLFQRVTLSEVLSVRYWAIMWSTYAQLDPAYVDTTSFGYCVDVGNGVDAAAVDFIRGHA